MTDLEVDLGGAHSGGRLDVELFPVLADLHVRLGGSRICHLPQHGIHSFEMKENASHRISDLVHVYKPNPRTDLVQKTFTLKDTIALMGYTSPNLSMYFHVIHVCTRVLKLFHVIHRMLECLSFFSFNEMGSVA